MILHYRCPLNYWNSRHSSRKRFGRERTSECPQFTSVELGCSWDRWVPNSHIRKISPQMWWNLCDQRELTAYLLSKWGWGSLKAPPACTSHILPTSKATNLQHSSSHNYWFTREFIYSTNIYWAFTMYQALLQALEIQQTTKWTRSLSSCLLHYGETINKYLLHTFLYKFLLIQEYLCVYIYIFICLFIHTCVWLQCGE